MVSARRRSGGRIEMWGPALALFVASCDPGPVQAAEESTETVPPAGVEARLTVDRRDLPDLLASRRVRILVPYARPFFFFDDAEPRGISYELFREYGSFVEQREDMRAGDLQVIYVPCELDLVIPWLNAGYGDVAAAALTVTPEREREVAFTDPLVSDVREIVVTAPDARALESVDGLAGREVWVAAGSSYAEHLHEWNEDFEQRGLEPIRINEAPPTLASEDLLEMVHAGIVEFAVCDDYKAELWAEVLPGLVPREDLVIHSGGAIAWAVRSDNPELRESLNAFVATARKGTLLGNILIKRYFGSIQWVENPIDPEGRARMDRYAGWIQALCDEYGFDWLRVAAQCFQESGLDPNAVSSSGAIGLMQLLPSTAADMGCDDPYDPEQNLRAGVRYLDWLRTHFVNEPEIGEIDRMDLIFAAYNAGPGNVRKWRALAPERGLDSNRWRGHVERLALEHVGIQPIRYVDNIEKYYVAYTLSHGLAEEREALRRSAAERR